MPLYEYECPSCARVFEFWQKISDPPRTECPECSGPLRKLVSLSSFQLKGGGWYADGYTAKPASEAKERSSGEKAGGKAASEGAASCKAAPEAGTSAPKKTAAAGSRCPVASRLDGPTLVTLD